MSALQEEGCVVCCSDDNSSASSSKLAVVSTEKGKQTLLESSIRRGDSVLTEYLLCKPSVIRVHEVCRISYNRDQRCLQLKRKTQGDDTQPDGQSKILRSSTESFEWKEDCFLCSQKAVPDCKHPRSSNDIRVAATRQLFETIKEACSHRQDQWAFEVLGRVMTCGDAVAAEARYHRHCYMSFTTGRSRCTGGKDDLQTVKQSGGRRPDLQMSAVFNDVCEWMEDNDSELYTVVEIQEEMRKRAEDPEAVYSVNYLKVLLQKRYGDSIWFASVSGRKDVVCFKYMASRIVNDTWYLERKQDIGKESERIVEAAAKLLKASIREANFDTENYPLNSEIRDKALAKNWVPPLLQTFLQCLVKDEIKQIAFGHSIVQACRPRSAVSPVLLAVGISVDHCLGAQWLLKELNALGYSVSVDEVNRYKQSVVQADGNDLPPSGPNIFTQWSADNVDHNVKTLDGSGTFHGMGIISMSVGGESSESSEVPVKRLSRVTVGNLIKGRGIPILRYISPNQPVLTKTVFTPFCNLLTMNSLSFSTSLDLLWHAGSIFQDQSKSRPSWGGFMQLVNQGDHQPAADFRMLPIIDMNPGDRSCILSTLIFVIEQAKAVNIATPCITFDQPLWLKAVEIIKSESLNIVCRLGGFHTLLSFLGSIGSVMSGSGLVEALECCYGSNTVGHMIAGKAYDRAVRGHLLVESALYTLLLQLVLEGVGFDGGSEISQLSSDDVSELRRLYDGVVDGSVDLKDLDQAVCLNNLNQALAQCKEILANKSRTAKLWLQYIDYVDILKSFLRAERTSDWHLHLAALKKMLDLFAATGHSNYAKCGRLYLQMMLQLKETHPDLQRKFAEEGFHTVRRSDRYWAGISTDLAIEQVMMKAVKSRGGLTHGRGMTDSVRLLWVHSMHKCATVHASLKILTGVEGSKSTHVELGRSRLQRDSADLRKMLDWFRVNNPFNSSDSRLRSLASGLVAADADGINCDRADEVGHGIMCRMDETAFADVVLKKVDQVKTLAALSKKVSVGGKQISIDANLLFSRLLIIMERKADMAPCFKYELTAMPASLFKNDGLRKTVKSALAKQLTRSLDKSVVVDAPQQYVLDGGCLLHRVLWSQGGSYTQVVLQYVGFVVNHYGSNCVVVFDGYSNGPTIKDHEHARRAAQSCPDIDVTEQRTVHRNQGAFLSNAKNKTLFVDMLSRGLQQAGYAVVQALDDADTLIVKTALEIARSGQPVTVVADDTDILVMLVHHYKQDMADIFMMSEMTRQRTARTSVTPVRAVREAIGDTAAEQLLVIHALSGCDSTSALYGQGKASIFRKVVKLTDTLGLTNTIGNPNASAETVSKAGTRLLTALYGGKEGESLDHLRYVRYMQLLASSTTRPRPERLPPTERAAHYHLLRVHLQTVQWQLLDPGCLKPTDWGWELQDGVYVPIATDLKAAPDDVLSVIVCQCKASTSKPCSSKQCTCRSYGLHCVPACKHCYGEVCTNAAPLTTTDVLLDSDDDAGDEDNDDDDVDPIQLADNDTAHDCVPECDLSDESQMLDGCGTYDDMWLDEEIVDIVTYMDL